MLEIYTKLGFDHILDPRGYDHILFVVALCAVYLFKEWKKVFILVTAFTIGHSLTLAMSSLDVIKISASLVETLIPITIAMTCVYNMVKNKINDEKNIVNYVIALGFGFIHGLGFSNYFKALADEEEGIIAPLFYFNLGVELGQIIIVAASLLLSFIIVDILKIKQKYYSFVISGLILVWALKMIFI